MIKKLVLLDMRR